MLFFTNKQMAIIQILVNRQSRALTAHQYIQFRNSIQFDQLLLLFIKKSLISSIYAGTDITKRSASINCINPAKHYRNKTPGGQKLFFLTNKGSISTDQQRKPHVKLCQLIEKHNMSTFSGSVKTNEVSIVLMTLASTCLKQQDAITYRNRIALR